MNDGGNPFEGGRFHYAKLGVDEEAQQSVPPPEKQDQAKAARHRMPVVDRVLGVLLGLVLGIGIVTAFVFLGSEDTIDAPRIQETVQQGAGRR